MELVDSECYLGVEIEIENATHVMGKQIRHWITKADGSLREGGVELLFPSPFRGIKAAQALHEAFDKLIDDRMTISPRTAIHVHVDIRDLTITQFKNLCIVYALLEEPLFEWVGDARSSNNFCLPWFEAEGDLPTIADVLSSSSSEFTRKARYVQRYAGLNLNAVSKFGSVEFRHLLTTKDKRRVFTWINMLLMLKQYAKNTERNGMGLLDHFSVVGPEAFVMEVFGDLAPHLNPASINLGLMVAHDLLSKETKRLESIFFAHLFERGEHPGYSKFIESRAPVYL